MVAARQLVTMQLLVTLAVAAAAALVHPPGSLPRRCSSVRHRCVPVASDRLSDNNRAARAQKQQERQTDADRAERALLDQQQFVLLKAHRAAIEEFEGSNDWRATLNELHRLRKQATTYHLLTAHYYYYYSLLTTNYSLLSHYLPLTDCSLLLLLLTSHHQLLPTHHSLLRAWSLTWPASRPQPARSPSPTSGSK
jgi:hypothetical protein